MQLDRNLAVDDHEPLPPDDDEPLPPEEEADRIVECTRRTSNGGKPYWKVVTARDLKGYTWSTTLGPKLEAFEKSGAPVTLDLTKDNRGDHRIDHVEAFEEEIEGVGEYISDKQRAETQLAGRQQSLIQQADALQVVDAGSYQRAAELAKTFAGMIKDAEEHFDPDIEAAHKLHKSLCEKRSTFLAPLQAALEAMKTRARAWWDEQERARLAEQRRLEEEDRVRREAERKRLEEQARQAEVKGDNTTARELKEEAAAVDDAPPPPPPPSAAPKVKGMSHREAWTFEVYDKQQFVRAAAGVDRMFAEIERRIAAFAKQRDELPETSAARDQVIAAHEALVDLHVALKAITPTIPLEAVDYNDVYVRARARADKSTLKWPGVRVYSKGSTSVRS